MRCPSIASVILLLLHRELSETYVLAKIGTYNVHLWSSRFLNSQLGIRLSRDLSFLGARGKNRWIIMTAKSH